MSTFYTQLASYMVPIEESTSKTMIIPIEGRDGFSLSSESVAGLTVEGRREGAGSWIDLESSSIDLSPDVGEIVAFEIRLTAPAIGSDIVRHRFRLLVKP